MVTNPQEDERDEPSSSSSNKSNPMNQYPNLPQPLILGSSSFTRKLILKEMGIPYHVVVRPIDEKGIGNRDTDDPTDLVLRLGRAKMSHLVQEIQAGRCNNELPSTTTTSTTTSTTTTRTTPTTIHPDNQEWNYVVLTGDQVVTCRGKIREKPVSMEQVYEFVQDYSQHPPSTIGSCILTHVGTGIQVSGVDVATVHFQSTMNGRTLVDQLLSADNGNNKQIMLSCAGAVFVEHPLVQEQVHCINGTIDSVMGLSKPLVLRLLQELSTKLNKHYLEKLKEEE